MLVIGLTGGIGTGKTVVSGLVQNLGASVINADQVGHEAYTPHSPAWQEVVAAFGDSILQDSGEIDRGMLGSIVFADPEQLAILNGIMHPRMASIVKEKLTDLNNSGIQVAFVEAAVLFEAVGIPWSMKSGPRSLPRIRWSPGWLSGTDMLRRRFASG